MSNQLGTGGHPSLEGEQASKYESLTKCSAARRCRDHDRVPCRDSLVGNRLLHWQSQEKFIVGMKSTKRLN
jgi:hypothetical protein